MGIGERRRRRRKGIKTFTTLYFTNGSGEGGHSHMTFTLRGRGTVPKADHCTDRLLECDNDKGGIH